MAKSRKRGSSIISGAINRNSIKNEEIGKSAWKSIDGNWLVRSRWPILTKHWLQLKRVDSIRKVHYRSRHFTLSTWHNKKVKDRKRSEHGYVCFSLENATHSYYSLSEYGIVRHFVYNDIINNLGQWKREGYQFVKTHAKSCPVRTFFF